MTVDFQNVADRLTIFGIALKKRLAEMAGVPENSLRLTDLRSGSIIAEFLVLPSVVDNLSASYFIELLRSAVANNAAELCALASSPLEGCSIELADLGFAKPSIEAMPVETYMQHMQQQQETDPQADGSDVKNVIIVVCAVAAAGLLLGTLYRLYMARSLKTKISSPDSSETYETKVYSIEASMEEGHFVEKKASVEKDDDKSTVCSSTSATPDKQSEPSLCGDSENGSTPKAGSPMHAMSG